MDPTCIKHPSKSRSDKECIISGEAAEIPDVVLVVTEKPLVMMVTTNFAILRVLPWKSFRQPDTFSKHYHLKLELLLECIEVLPSDSTS